MLDLFRKSGALLEGHFRLSSGLHSDRYLQSALVLQYPRVRGSAGPARWPNGRAHLQPTVVLSPALGGIVIGQEVGRALGVRAIFAERQDGTLTLRRGFTLDASRSRARRRGRHHDRRIDARDRRGGRSRSARTSSVPPPSSIAVPIPRGSICRCSRWCDLELPTYQPTLSALREGRSRRQARIEGGIAIDACVVSWVSGVDCRTPRS